MDVNDVIFLEDLLFLDLLFLDLLFLIFDIVFSELADKNAQDQHENSSKSISSNFFRKINNDVGFIAPTKTITYAIHLQL